jgi:phosphoserine phosphatase RsbU/P
MIENELFPKKPLIMVVDDVARNIQIVGKLLDSGGYDISYATNAKDALEVLSNKLPDLILLDVMMPDVDGFQLCEIIKKDISTKEIPVIFLTARISTEDIIKGFQVGAVDYIMKPFNVKELLIRIKTHLELKFSKEIIHNKVNEINEVNKKLVEINAEKDKYLSIINKELESASEYVISLLPKPILKGAIKTDWVYIPSSGLGGDIFGYRNLDRDNFSFYLLDVCGHGIRSALHSVAILNVLNYQTLSKVDFKDPVQVLKELNQLFQMTDYDDLYFSIIYGIYNKKTRNLNYASAGHPPSLMISSEGTQVLKSQNRVMGFLKEIDIRADNILIPEHTDLYVYSDGTYEIPLEKYKRWQYEDLMDFIIYNRDAIGDELLNIYKNSRKMNKNEHLPDDFSVVKISFD